MSKCLRYDSRKEICNNPNNPAGIRTKSGVSTSRCGSKSEQCEIQKSVTINNFRNGKFNIGIRFCSYCGNSLDNMALNRGRCPHCGKYL